MKKYVVFLLALLVIFSLSGCSGSSSDAMAISEKPSQKNGEASTTQKEEETSSMEKIDKSQADEAPVLLAEVTADQEDPRISVNDAGSLVTWIIKDGKTKENILYFNYKGQKQENFNEIAKGLALNTLGICTGGVKTQSLNILIAVCGRQSIEYDLDQKKAIQINTLDDMRTSTADNGEVVAYKNTFASDPSNELFVYKEGKYEPLVKVTDMSDIYSVRSDRNHEKFVMDGFKPGFYTTYLWNRKENSFKEIVSGGENEYSASSSLSPKGRYLYYYLTAVSGGKQPKNSKFIIDLDTNVKTEIDDRVSMRYVSDNGILFGKDYLNYLYYDIEKKSWFTFDLGRLKDFMLKDDGETIFYVTYEDIEGDDEHYTYKVWKTSFSHIKKIAVEHSGDTFQ